MSASLNTFAAVMLAFPIYLAQKGKLSQYVDLAKPGNSQSSNGTASGNSTPTNNVGSNSQASTGNTFQNAESAFALFSESSALFS